MIWTSITVAVRDSEIASRRLLLAERMPPGAGA